MRRNCPDNGGVIWFTPRASLLLLDEPRHETSQLHQIGQAKQQATPADDDLWIGCDDVGPGPRHRADVIIVDSQQEPRPVAVVSLADAFELLSAERVKRVGHAHKARTHLRRACSSS
jgi:hypothetical protein